MLARLLLFTVFCLCGSLFSGSFDDSSNKLPEDKLPDFRFAMEPYRIGEVSAVSGIVQAGLRDYRINGTYALALMEKHLFKVSAEYLRQKLGFGYSSGHIHKWVDQYAIGAKSRLELDCGFLDHLDMGMAYSHSPSKNLGRKLDKGQNFVVRRRIAGANAFSAEAESSVRVFKGAVAANLFYDYVRFDQKYHSKKTLSGPGIGLSVYHPFLNTAVLHLAAELRRPYLFMQARIDSKVRLASKLFTAGAFIESTKGYSSIPSSTLFGVEFFFDFGPKKSINPDTCCPDISLLEQFAASPAVFRPQVLAMADQEKYIFCQSADATVNRLTVPIPLGAVSIDLSSYFLGTEPFVFVATGLPQGFSVDPLSGVLSGINSGNAGGEFTGEVTAINHCNRVSLPVTFIVASLP